MACGPTRARRVRRKRGAQSSLSKMSHVAQKTPINSFQAKHLKGSVCLLGFISRRAGSTTTDSRVAAGETSFAHAGRRFGLREKGANLFISRSAAAQSGRKSAARQANDEYPLDLTPHPRLIPGLSDRSDPKSGSPLDEGGSRRSPGPSADRYAPSQEFHAHFRGVIALLRHPTAVTGRSDGRETRAIISYDAHQSDARSTEPRDVSGARTLLFAGTRFALHFFAFHDARGSFRDLGRGAGDVGPRVR